MLKALTRVFGSRNERLVKGYGRAVRASAALEAQIGALSDDEMRAKTFEFRTRLDSGVPLQDLQPEAFALVRSYKGSHSGEHGDGLVRSEVHEYMFGPRIVRAFEQTKDLFDPRGLMNPGKIVRAPDFDDRTNFRYDASYSVADIKPALDWSAYPGPAGGFSGAVEMCNNNGACRKSTGGAMCPSYRVTRNESDVAGLGATVLNPFRAG